jgi:ABC-type uncharacterized transport system substrate-binding protein
MWRQSAIMVAKVLKGAKPVDMPVEQPTKFELVVNDRTAKALGLTIPRTKRTVLSRRPVCPLSGNSGHTCSRGFDRIER